MSETVYHFRLRGKTFGPGTLDQLTANPLLTQKDAVRIQVRQRGETGWTPLSSLVDFSAPWRSPLRQNRGYVPLPRFWRTLGGLIRDINNFHVAPEAAEEDALKPKGGRGNDYYWRWGGTKRPFRPVWLRNIVRRPPFRVEHAWRVEMRRRGSRLWVPLSSLIDLSNGWPEIKEEAEADGTQAALSDPHGQAAPASAPQPVNAGRGELGFLLVIMLMAGIALTGYALTMETGVEGPVGEVHNLSKAHNQSVVLAIGLAAVGVGVIALVIQSGRKQ